MKLGELIERLDTEWDTYISPGDLAQECGIHDYIDANLIDHGFSRRPITQWCCTDTWVGMSVIYLHGRPIVVSDQPARKSDTTYQWFSVEDARMVRDILLKLVDAEQKEMFEVVNLEQEIGTPDFELSFSSQVLHKEAIYKGETVPVVKTFQGYDRNTWKTIVIKYKGKDITVNMDDVKFPVKLLPETG